MSNEQPTTPETVSIKIYQDGELKKEFKNQEGDFCAFGWLLRNQGQSTNYALKYGGWKVEVTNDQTGAIEFWKPYD